MPTEEEKLKSAKIIRDRKGNCMLMRCDECFLSNKSEPSGLRCAAFGNNSDKYCAAIDYIEKHEENKGKSDLIKIEAAKEIIECKGCCGIVSCHSCNILMSGSTIFDKSTCDLTDSERVEIATEFVENHEKNKGKIIVDEAKDISNKPYDIGNFEDVKFSIPRLIPYDILMQINKIIDEYNKSCKQYDQNFNSTHEGYAVLKEEIEELDSDLLCIRGNLNSLWTEIKKDNWDNMEIEAAQVGAMALKFLCSMGKIKNKYGEKK